MAWSRRARPPGSAWSRQARPPGGPAVVSTGSTTRAAVVSTGSTTRGRSTRGDQDLGDRIEAGAVVVPVDDAGLPAQGQPVGPVLEDRDAVVEPGAGEIPPGERRRRHL